MRNKAIQEYLLNGIMSMIIQRNMQSSYQSIMGPITICTTAIKESAETEEPTSMMGKEMSS